MKAEKAVKNMSAASKTEGAGPVAKQAAQKGFSLIELMIAMLLGLLLVGGIIGVFLEGRRNFVQDEQVARVQENGRYALRLIAREISMGGFMGGVVDLDKFGTTAPTTCLEWLRTPQPIYEVNNNASTTTSPFTCMTASFPVAGAGTTAHGTDVIAIKRVADTPIVDSGGTPVTTLTAGKTYAVIANGGRGTAALSLGSTLDLTPGAGIVDTGAGTTTGVSVWDYYAKILYLDDDEGVPSLCMRRLSTTAASAPPNKECFVQGIEDLQLQLGVDTDDDGIANQYISDSTVGLGVGGAVVEKNIVSVRVYLLARSIDPIRDFPAEARTYALGSETVATNDQYFRRVYETTVRVRNQVLEATP